ncbi:MAG: AgmX/PglI C-terminal domain-containing protein [Myxococcales bacterium]|nr:AgmX/PglI C-terminal domain-containing protein [Myxococcota bacterium]MDW8281298.1 AgmX/PglI C-terminal domain-containing protein [Myxococcales bacterium]
MPLPIVYEHTDLIRVVRRRRPRSRFHDVLHMLLLGLVCSAVAIAVGLGAYGLLTRNPSGAASQRTRTGGDAPSHAVLSPPAGPRAVPPRGRYRTRELVVSVPSSPPGMAERRRGPNRPMSLPSAGPTSITPLDPGLVFPEATPVEAALPTAPEDQQHDAEAQLTAADIEFVASTHNAQVRHCYERAFKDVPGGGPGGKVELALTLGEDGRALQVSTVLNTTGSERLARCLEQRIAEWRFPRPLGGAKTYLFPFVFLPGAGPSVGAAAGSAR